MPIPVRRAQHGQQEPRGHSHIHAMRPPHPCPWHSHNSLRVCGDLMAAFGPKPPRSRCCRAAGSFLQGGRAQGLLGAQSLPSATPLLPHQACGGWGTAIDRCNCRANTASLGSCITIMKINERLIFRAVWTPCSSRRPHQLRQPERRHHQNGGAEPPALLRTQERKQPGDMGSPKQGQRRSEASCCCWHCWGHSASRSQARLGTAGQGGSLHAFIHHIPKAAERHSRAGAVLLVTPYLQAALAKSHLT